MTLANLSLDTLGLLDIALIIFILVFALDGYRRGFLGGVFSLLGLAFGFFLAQNFYLAVGSWLALQVGLLSSLADLLAMIVLFSVGVGLFSWVVGIFFRAFGSFLLFGPIGLLNSLAGFLVGGVTGLILLALFIRLSLVIPGTEPVASVISASPVATEANTLLKKIAPSIETTLGEISRGIPRLNRSVNLPEGGEGGKLDLPEGIAVWEDPEAEAMMLRLLNQERAVAGLKPVRADDSLRVVARAHSAEMFRLKYFAHESPVTGTPFDRLRKAGIRYDMAAENLAYAPTVEVAHRGLMNSTGHRRNILTPEFTKVGIGVMQSQLWGKMFTQLFSN